MEKEQLKKEYDTYKTTYKEFQKEIYIFINNIKKKRASTIDIADVKPRKGIKSIESILENIDNPEKDTSYYKSIFDVKDIAGVRITCHCEEDRYAITEAIKFGLENMKTEYEIIDIDLKGGENNNGKSNPSYRATHITLAKDINGNRLLCEIQIRTVMVDARAVQDRKYLYGQETPGESKVLTNAVSQIMIGCDKLWSLVRSKSLKKGGIKPSKETIIQKKEFVARPMPSTIEEIEKMNARFQLHREKASEGLKKLNINTYMEIEAHLLNRGLNINIIDLKKHASNATIENFGRPIGVYIDSREEFAPKPDNEGIFAEISIKEKTWSPTNKGESSYDYRAINKNGAFYLKKSLFEDGRDPNKIFFNTRIVRITEVFMYIYKLYSAFGISKNTEFEIMIKHGGLKGRLLGSSSFSRSLFGERKIETDQVSTTIRTTLNEIDTNMVDLVEQFTKPLFEQFDFFQLSRNVLEDIVKKYLQGETT